MGPRFIFIGTRDLRREAVDMQSNMWTCGVSVGDRTPGVVNMLICVVLSVYLDGRFPVTQPARPFP